jgi:hypothetical protein
MCKSVADGGERCIYADAINNIRKKTRYKHRDTYESAREQEVTQAVQKWKEANPELVREHLPEHMPFQATPNKKEVPAQLKTLLSQRSRVPITGLPKEEREALTRAMAKEREKMEENLDKEHVRAISKYTITFYDILNRSLRRSGVAEHLREEPHLRDGFEEQVKNATKSMDEVFERTPNKDEPRKVYRFFRVPAGVKPQEYIEKYFADGSAFKDRGFMSTTADPEFIMAHMYDRNKGKQNTGYVVMEILTKEGISLQDNEISRGGDVQSLEHEVLLPRNSKFRVIGNRKSQRFEFASDRRDLNGQYNRDSYYMSSDSSYQRWGWFKKGDRLNFPVIQMIDEKLIAES